MSIIIDFYFFPCYVLGAEQKGRKSKMFFKNNCSEEEDVPYSPRARNDFMSCFVGLDLQVVELIVIFFVGLLAVAIITRDNFLIISWLLIFSFICLAFFFQIREKKEKIREHNLKDSKLATNLFKNYEAFCKDPPNFFDITHKDKVEEDGWRPIKVIRHTDSKLSGEINGGMLGFYSGLFSGYFGGKFKRRVFGKIEQDALNQVIEVILEKDGRSLRIFSLNIEVCKTDLIKTFKELASSSYYWGTHFAQALMDVFDLEGVKKILQDEKIGLDIYDDLELSLRRPFIRRPVVKITGILEKEGMILACVLSLNNGEPRIVFPIEIVCQIKKIAFDTIS